jgi:hypothetical protein
MMALDLPPIRMALSFSLVLCQTPKAQSTYDILSLRADSFGMSGPILFISTALF